LWLVRVESGSVDVLDHGAPSFRCWVKPATGELRSIGFFSFAAGAP
jgi:hypothetical protein